MNRVGLKNSSRNIIVELRFRPQKLCYSKVVVYLQSLFIQIIEEVVFGHVVREGNFVLDEVQILQPVLWLVPTARYLL